jgi:hypothetical protein
MNITRLAACALVVTGLAACAPSGSNPPGTASGRALDRAAGTNVSGAYPSQSDGMPGNPPGTATGRTIDRALDTGRPTAPGPTR